jgi:Na+-transporting NADH:ubiquinone oxidoreductase subunit NqrA
MARKELTVNEMLNLLGFKNKDIALMSEERKLELVSWLNIGGYDYYYHRAPKKKWHLKKV